jgi:hypothetical protein
LAEEIRYIKSLRNENQKIAAYSSQPSRWSRSGRFNRKRN